MQEQRFEYLGDAGQQQRNDGRHGSELIAADV
jgi:hypothetical protein